MAIAFDAASTYFYDVDPSAEEWTHTPVGTPRGILVLVTCGSAAATQGVTAMTYGGVGMTRLAGGPFGDVGSETGNVDGWFLGASIPTGAQTIAFTPIDNLVGNIHFGGISLTAADDTTVHAINSAIASGSLENPSSTLALTGVTAFVAGAIYSGQGDVTGIAPLTDWTSVVEADFGTDTGAIYRYNTIGSTDVTVGWTQTADDARAVFAAIREGGPKSIVAGGGSYAVTGTAASLEHGWLATAGSGSYAITGTAAALTLNAGATAISELYYPWRRRNRR